MRTSTYFPYAPTVTKRHAPRRRAKTFNEIRLASIRGDLERVARRTQASAKDARLAARRRDSLDRLDAPAPRGMRQ